MTESGDEKSREIFCEQRLELNGENLGNLCAAQGTPDRPREPYTCWPAPAPRFMGPFMALVMGPLCGLAGKDKGGGLQLAVSKQLQRCARVASPLDTGSESQR